MKRLIIAGVAALVVLISGIVKPANAQYKKAVNRAVLTNARNQQAEYAWDYVNIRAVNNLVKVTLRRQDYLMNNILHANGPFSTPHTRRDALSGYKPVTDIFYNREPRYKLQVYTGIVNSG